MKLLDPTHLSRGTARQKQAYEALQKLQIFEHLAEYSPVLAGTIPLDIDTPDSDLDVICSAPNLVGFADRVRELYGAHQRFELHHKLKDGIPAVVARFYSSGFPIEIFAQPQSVFTQNAVLHMLVEARLLTFAPVEAKEKIRRLKLEGNKTEPAFAECFAIEGDPYAELLKIAMLPDHEILMIAHRFRWMAMDEADSKTQQ